MKSMERTKAVVCWWLLRFAKASCTEASGSTKAGVERWSGDKIWGACKSVSITWKVFAWWQSRYVV